MKLLTVESRLRRVLTGFAILLLLLVLCAGYATLIEPRWLRLVRLSLSDSPSVVLVHVSDLHYKGDQEYLDKVVRIVNEAQADLVCITGDLVEDARHLPPVLAAIEGIHAAVYAVPGNHEHWAAIDFSLVDESCEKTGGAFLVNSSARFGDGWIVVGIDDRLTGHAVIEKAFVDVTVNDTGAIQHETELAEQNAKKSPAGTLYSRVIFLTHCPVGVELLGERKVALALAGHSHGGQVHLPIIGALSAPQGVGRYDRGYFETPNGPLYVNSGIGTFVPVRFLCRPEIAIVGL